MFAKCAYPALSLLLNLLSPIDLHLDSKCLHEHVNCIVILSRKWNYNVSVLHSWLYEIIVSRFYKLAVLSENVDDCAPAVGDVTLDATSEANIIRS